MLITSGVSMRGKIIVLAVIMASAAPFGVAKAAEARAAVFDLELKDTSLEGETGGVLEAQTQRLELLNARLREALDASERYAVVDIAPVRDKARASNLQSCGGCDWQMAAELGADLAVTGVVQKVSNLILNINLYVRDAKTGKLVEGYSADIRSNTDESWLRGLNWLLKNRLLAEKAPQ
jgi:hypothetical protein